MLYRNEFFDDTKKMILSCPTSKVCYPSSGRADWLVVVRESKFGDTVILGLICIKFKRKERRR